MISFKHVYEDKRDLRGLPVAAVIFICFIANCHALVDPDFWWHARLGQDLLEKLRFRLTDLYSFSQFGKDYLYPDWLGGIFWGGISQIWGAPGAIIARAIVLGLQQGILVTWLKRQGASTLFLVSAVLAQFFCFKNYSLCRPQLLSYLLCTLLFWALTERKIFFVILVQALWINVHRSAFLSIPVSMLMVLFAKKGDRKFWIGICLAVMCASCLHPNILESLKQTMQLLQSPEMKQSIEEWKPLRLENVWFSFSPLIWTVPLGALAILSPIGRRSTKILFFVGCALFVCGFKAERYVPYATIALIASSIALTAQSMSGLRLKKGFLLTFLFSHLAFMALSWAGVRKGVPQIDKPLLKVGPKMPVGMTAWFQKLPGSLNLFAPIECGGYFINQLYTHGDRVWIDGRTGILYPFEQVALYNQLVSDPQFLSSFALKSGVQIVVVAQSHQKYLQWPVAYIDDNYIAYYNPEFLEEHLELRRYILPDAKNALELLKRGSMPEATWNSYQMALDEMLKSDTNNFRLTMLRTYMASQNQNDSEYKNWLKKLLIINPQYDIAKSELARLTQLDHSE